MKSVQYISQFLKQTFFKIEERRIGQFNEKKREHFQDKEII